MRILLSSLCILGLSGCEYVDRLGKPTIIPVGNFDGCEVKMVHRGSELRNFYIARCGDTVTTTNNIGDGTLDQTNRTTTINHSNSR